VEWTLRQLRMKASYKGTNDMWRNMLACKTMSDIVLVGLLSLVGTLAGTFGGILVSNRLTTYRISQLEQKQDKHNAVIERMYHAEERLCVVDEKIKVIDHRIADLEHEP
jgi:hypothetical protein